jgi:hypothetical protein
MLTTILMTGTDNQLAALKSKISLLEAQLQSERERVRDLQEERDEAVKGLALALNESAGIRSENKALRIEIANLKSQNGHSSGSHQPKTTSAKERVRERVETERKRDTVNKGKSGKHNEGNQSFVEVPLPNDKTNLSLTRLRNFGKKSESFARERPRDRPLRRQIPSQRHRQQRKLSIRRLKMLRATFRQFASNWRTQRNESQRLDRNHVTGEFEKLLLNLMRLPMRKERSIQKTLWHPPQATRTMRKP